MTRKIFALILAVLLIIPVAALAKKPVEIPMSERKKIFVEVTDSTNVRELDTAQILRDMIIAQLDAKNLFNTVNPTAENFLANIKTLGDKKGAGDVGDFILFSSAGDNALYGNYAGAEYVVRCEILGLGVAKGEPDTFDLTPGIGVGVEENHRVGVGIGIFGGTASQARNFFVTAVNMKLIDVASGDIIYRQNLLGRVLKRGGKPGKGYDDANDEVYLKSLKNVAENLGKRLAEYEEKNWAQEKTK